MKNTQYITQLYNQNVIFEIKGLTMKLRMSEVNLTVGVKGPSHWSQLVLKDLVYRKEH